MITRFALSAAVALAVMGWLASQRTALIDKGEAKAVAQVEQRNETVRKKAKAASRKSADPKSSGMLNPYIRD